VDWAGTLRGGVGFFRKHADHGYSFTDCTSLVVMRELGASPRRSRRIRHFVEAGFKVLLPIRVTGATSFLRSGPGKLRLQSRRCFSRFGQARQKSTGSSFGFEVFVPGCQNCFGNNPACGSTYLSVPSAAPLFF
jgi:hypothetical protein